MARRGATVPLLILAAAAAAAGGCAVAPPPEPPEMREQSEGFQGLELERPWRAGGGTEGPIRDDWVAGFGDERLDALVAEAVARNPDLRVAALRVEQAAVYVRLAEAELRPKIGFFGTGGINASGGDPSSALQGGMLGISWEPDLWGRIRYARNAQREIHASVAADREFARQSIAAGVAKTWFAATELGLEQRLSERMAASGSELVRLAEDRLRVGAGDEQAVVSARARSAGLDESARRIRLAQAQTVRALELLLGRYPAAELVAPAELPPPPGPLPVGLPLEMLERRPDIVAAERRVAAAFDRVGEAKAARLPRLVLAASVGAFSSDVLELKEDFENPSVGAGGRLVAPIYQGGALKATVELRTLEQREAVEEYARQALVALGDVENALAAGENLAERAELLARVVEQNRRALELAETLRRVGRGDRRAVLERQIDLDSAELTLLGVEAERLAQRVNLHLALGGSFEARPEGES